MLSYQISDADKAKLEALDNPKVMKIIEETTAATKPSRVVVFDDSAEDMARIRQLAIENNEEKPKVKGKTFKREISPGFCELA